MKIIRLRPRKVEAEEVDRRADEKNMVVRVGVLKTVLGRRLGRYRRRSKDKGI